MLSSQSSLVEWVGFDDVRSVEIKVKYAMDNNLGGVMLWALDMDDFSGTFCNQGTYPLLKVMNYYLNPKVNVELPLYDSIWKVNSPDTNTESPKLEADFIVPQKELFDATGFSSSNNIFGLIDNNVMQVYKFCQCKNNLHTIISSMNTHENYSYKIDCNHKRVYSMSDPNPSIELTPDDRKKFLESKQPEKKNKNPWLFSINSSRRLFCDLFFIQITLTFALTLFRLFF